VQTQQLEQRLDLRERDDQVRAIVSKKRNEMFLTTRRSAIVWAYCLGKPRLQHI